MNNESWKDYEPAPLEHFHSLLMKYFHEYRLSAGKKIIVAISGSEFNNIVARAKTETYNKYKKLNLEKAILKTDL